MGTAASAPGAQDQRELQDFIKLAFSTILFLQGLVPEDAGRSKEFAGPCVRHNARGPEITGGRPGAW